MRKDEFEYMLSCKDTDHLASDVSNEVYRSAVRIFEYLEGKKIITGNGHHDAQRLAILAEYLIVKKSKLKKSKKKPEEIMDGLMQFMV
jgi:hypothetical protein